MLKKLINPLSIFQILSRGSLAAIFIRTGYSKYQQMEHTIEFFKQNKIPFAQFTAPAVGITECVCGILIAFGLMFKWGCRFLIFFLIVALVTTQGKNLETYMDFLTSVEFLLILVLMGMLALGPGRLSVDQIIARFRR